MYRQGDIIAVYYPLTDKPAKTKLRPAIVISNDASNKLDNDILVCPITTKNRDNEFSYGLANDQLIQPILPGIEIRCNKIMTIRVWEKQVIGKISAVNSETLIEVLQLVKKVFE